MESDSQQSEKAFSIPASIDTHNAILVNEEENPDVVRIKNTMASMGITSYEDNVIPMLLEFCDEYKRRLVAESKTYAEVCGQRQIGIPHVIEASTSLNRRYFSSVRKYPNEAQKVNTAHLKKDGEGVVLPHQSNLMSGTEYTLPATDH